MVVADCCASGRVAVHEEHRSVRRDSVSRRLELAQVKALFWELRSALSLSPTNRRRPGATREGPRAGLRKIAEGLRLPICATRETMLEQFQFVKFPPSHCERENQDGTRGYGLLRYVACANATLAVDKLFSS